MILSVKDLSFSYPGREVLRQISFSIGKGDCIGILGTNGTGKSTLLKNLNKILKPDAGVVYIGEEDIRQLSGPKLAQRIGYIAQNQQSVRSTVFDAVLLGRKPYIKWDVGQKDLGIVEDVLKAFELEEYSLRYTDELSGGELQKVAIARALAQEPKILLMDEPTSNLDMKNQMEVIDTIKEIVKTRGIAVVVTMHDLNLALRFADKFLLLKDGAVYAAGGREIITRENIKAVYDVEVAVEKFYDIPFVIPLRTV